MPVWSADHAMMHHDLFPPTPHRRPPPSEKSPPSSSIATPCRICNVVVIVSPSRRDICWTTGSRVGSYGGSYSGMEVSLLRLAWHSGLLSHLTSTTAAMLVVVMVLVQVVGLHASDFVMHTVYGSTSTPVVRFPLLPLLLFL